MVDQSETSVDRRQAGALRYVLVAALLPLCWLAMTVVHEAGHVAGATLTGGNVVKVMLHPLAISRTDVRPNPRPNAVAWSGPVAGVLLPIGIWLLCVILELSTAYLVRFFAGFCALANGLYLGVGSFERIGDAGDLLRSGSATWQLWLFGVVATVIGFLLWHGQAGCFGFGPNARSVARQHAIGAAMILVALVIIELWLS